MSTFVSSCPVFSTDVNGSTLTWGDKYGIGFAMLGGFVLVAFGLLVITRGKCGSIKPASALSFINLIFALFVTVSAVIVLVSNHWFKYGFPNGGGAYHVGLIRACNSAGECIDWTLCEDNGASLGRASAGGLGLISIAAVGGFLQTLLILRTWAPANAYLNSSFSLLPVVLSFIIFAGYLTGCGAAVNIKQTLRGDVSLAGSSFSYEYAFGLTIAGWSVAFFLFVTTLVEQILNKGKAPAKAAAAGGEVELPAAQAAPAKATETAAPQPTAT